MKFAGRGSASLNSIVCVSRTLISTDLGQTINPPVAEGFAMFAQRLLDAGFSPDEIKTMAVTIPTRLVEE